MHLTLSPVRRDDRPHVSVAGDVLTIGAHRFDFSRMTDGDVLPAEAVQSEWIAGPVSREAGVLRLALMLSHGEHAAAETLFPEPVTAEDGPVPLPPHGDTETAAPVKRTSAGVIDWSLLCTAADRAAQALAERRASASLGRGAFAVAAFAAGLITEAEAEAWAGGASLPQIIANAFAQIEDPTQRLAARIEALTTPTIRRGNPLLMMLQATLGLTDAQVDALFGIAP